MLKNNKKIDLLNVSESKRAETLEKIKRQLRERIVEQKLLHSLLEAENLTINGNPICKAEETPKGFYFPTSY